MPVGDRACAVAGLAMYTASRPTVRLAQRLAWLCASVSPHLLPGKRGPIELDGWESLVASWSGALGRVDSVAVYRRRDGVRGGLTLVAVRSGTVVGLLKVREDGTSLVREQRILAAIRSRNPQTFAVPQPLGCGTAGNGLAWSAQQFVFSRPHEPVTVLSDDLSDELSELATAAFHELGWQGPDQPGDGWTPAHGDLTPWNLRRDHRGRQWLFDWEDARWAPPLADRTYFNLTARALSPRYGRVCADPEALGFWRTVVQDRIDDGHRGDLNFRMLDTVRSWHAESEHT